MDTNSFEFGHLEGVKLLKLLERLCKKWPDPSPYTSNIFGCASEKFGPLWEQFKGFPDRPEITGFLSAVTPVRELDMGILTLMPLQTLNEFQWNCAPLCTIPKSFGFLGIASWCGQSDGDAWAVNLRTGVLLSIDLGSGSSDLEEITQRSYAHSPNLAHWRHGRMADAVRRGWILSTEIEDLV